MRVDASCPRAGLALLEVIVGLMLLAVGVLGLAAATATVARQSEIAHARRRLAVQARNEMERRMAGAANAMHASDSAGGYDLQWDTVEAGVRQLRLVAGLRWRSAVVNDTLIALLDR